MKAFIEGVARRSCSGHTLFERTAERADVMKNLRHLGRIRCAGAWVRGCTGAWAHSTGTQIVLDMAEEGLAHANSAAGDDVVAQLQAVGAEDDDCRAVLKMAKLLSLRQRGTTGET